MNDVPLPTEQPDAVSHPVPAAPRELPTSERGETWVTNTPGVCGGSARIRNSRITIWGLVNRRRLGWHDGDILTDVHGLTRADLDLAWDYYERHKEEIDQAIRENEEV